jgi:3-phosphoshikimate 1-carboxyvinyltransferase
MILITKKSHLSGKVTVPGSKSHTIRAVAIGSLANGTSKVRKPLISSDALSAVDCYRVLGAKIDTENDDLWVINGLNGKINPIQNKIDVGNSGTTMNLAIGSCALISPEIEVLLTGDHQIQNRPVGPILNAVNKLGANGRTQKDNGCPPLTISGKLRGGEVSVECKSSQYLSSLLLACPLAESDTEIDVPLLYEPDYARITLDWLDRQGIEYEMKEDLSWFRISGCQQYNAFDMSIPADFSSATFFLCAGALVGKNVLIQGLDFNDSQPDKAVAEYLIEMGADLSCSEHGINVGHSDLVGCEIDMNHTPDALPAMAVTACFAEGTTRLVNVPQARNKETDRIACMAKELSKLGANVEELPDGLVIHGRSEGSNLKPCPVSGYGDHRIVMAMSIAGMALDGEIAIDTAEAMNVTFPEFVTLMKKLGAHMTLSNA